MPHKLRVPVIINQSNGSCNILHCSRCSYSITSSTILRSNVSPVLLVLYMHIYAAPMKLGNEVKLLLVKNARSTKQHLCYDVQVRMSLLALGGSYKYTKPGDCGCGFIPSSFWRSGQWRILTKFLVPSSFCLIPIIVQ